MNVGPGPAGENRLLAALPSNAFARLASRLERVRLEAGSALYQADSSIDHAWFLTSGVVSLLVVSDNGGIMEVASIGREGMVGVSGIMRTSEAAAEARVQIAGEALRIQMKTLRELIKQAGVPYELLFQYLGVLNDQILRTISCNRFHTAEQRLARWLLMVHDQIPAGTLELTHDSLAQVLGVSRSRTSLAAEKLQREGAIHYLRGRIHTPDRQNLEAAACDCYYSIRKTLNAPPLSIPKAEF